jgi:hypothetical protein
MDMQKAIFHPALAMATCGPPDITTAVTGYRERGTSVDVPDGIAVMATDSTGAVLGTEYDSTTSVTSATTAGNEAANEATTVAGNDLKAIVKATVKAIEVANRAATVAGNEDSPAAREVSAVVNEATSVVVAAVAKRLTGAEIA